MADANGTDAPMANGSETEQPLARRRASTVLWHRLVRSLLYLLAWIFLVLVILGNTSNKPILRDTYFMYLDLSNIIPMSVPNPVLVDTIARSIGLHDFYQVGLWNFCEGYNNQGITGCSHPQALYAFNPVNILLNELLYGATIALPANISKPLNLAKIVSHWMFGLFIVAAVLNFVLIFISTLAVSSRPPQSIKAWTAAYKASSENSSSSSSGDTSDGTTPTPGAGIVEGPPPHRRRTFIPLRSMPMMLLAFITALFTIVASAIATVMFTIFANVFANADPSLHIKAHVGKQMIAFMWIASVFSFLAYIVQVGSCCASCCGGHRARKQLKEMGVGPREKN